MQNTTFGRIRLPNAILAGMLTIAALVFFSGKAHAAAYSGAWEPLYASQFYLEVSIDANSKFSLHMFDWGNPGTTMLILDNEHFIDSSKVYFRYNQNDLSWYAGLSYWNTPFFLGEDKLFGLCFFNEEVAPPVYNYTYEADHFLFNSWYIIDNQSGEFNTCMSVLMSGAQQVPDADPVPLPSALLLFGLGLSGFLGIKKRTMAGP